MIIISKNGVASAIARAVKTKTIKLARKHSSSLASAANSSGCFRSSADEKSHIASFHSSAKSPGVRNSRASAMHQSQQHHCRSNTSLQYNTCHTESYSFPMLWSLYNTTMSPIYGQTRLLSFDALTASPLATGGIANASSSLGSTNSESSQTPKSKPSTLGTVTKTLRVLDMSVVKKILTELRSVDVNSDGKIDNEELKELLRKHNSAFTEEEIIQIGELFYAGRSGGSVPFDRFVEAIDRVVHLEEVENNDLVRKDDEGNPLQIGTCADEYVFVNKHQYTDEELDRFEMKHVEPKTIRDRLAFNAVKFVRYCFDTATGWNVGSITPEKILHRVIYLETIAAVPGMVAAVVRHFKSLRAMQRDGGMLQMFLDEANNERLHLLSFIRLKDPSRFFRAAVILGQFGFGSLFLTAYLVSPSFCHRFVGYIEEEACLTYTKIINTIEASPDDSDLGRWKTDLAPKIARSYWKLGEQGTILDLMYVVRADEAEHRDVNHVVSELKEGMPNPVSNTEERLNTMLLKYVKDVMEREDARTPLTTSSTDATVTN